MKLNPNFYIIEISKKLQQEKRKKLTVATVGYLGIKYSENTGDDGFRILNVENESPAFRAGFKDGDIIKSINGTTVKNFEDMFEMVSAHPPGSTIEIGYINSLSISAEITKRNVVLAEKPLSLEVPANSQDFRFNLQFGKIVEMGKNVKDIFPEANIGDILLVHHYVEYKERAENDINWNDWHFLEGNENYEYRFVQAETEVLGIWRPQETDVTKSIVPFPLHVFCHASFQKASIQMTESGIWVPDAWKESMEDLEAKLDDLMAQIHALNANTVMQEVETKKNQQEKNMIKRAIDSVNDERRKITRKMHQTKLIDATVLFVNDRTNEEYGFNLSRGANIIADGSLLYPLDIMGTPYVLVRAPYIEAVHN